MIERRVIAQQIGRLFVEQGPDSLDIIGNPTIIFWCHHYEMLFLGYIQESSNAGIFNFNSDYVLY